METQIVKKDTAVTTSFSPTDLLKLAVEKNLDVEKLEKLMNLQERWNAQQAKKSFLKAMSKFQSKCPVLNKSKKVGFTSKKTSSKVEYSYIPLGQITAQIKELLMECGLSYRWETKDNEGKITITCIVSHIDGHSEQNSMTAGKDATGAKNDIQQIGSTMTYLQRYTLIGALGISSADNDVDGKETPKKEIKLSIKDSTHLLIESKIEIDKFEKADELQNKGKAFYDEQGKKGMNEKDQKELAAHITLKFDELNKIKKQENEYVKNL